MSNKDSGGGDPTVRRTERARPGTMSLPLRLVLGAVAIAGSHATTHSLLYFRTGVSAPEPGLPAYVSVGYLDDNLFVECDSDSGLYKPRAQWIKDNVGDDYWESGTQRGIARQQEYRINMRTLMTRYNQTGGFHTLQFKLGCELQDGRSTGRYFHFGYDGRDFISLDKETLTWTAADTEAQVTKRKWEADRSFAQMVKQYVEQQCVEWLRKYLEYGKETLQRKGFQYAYDRKDFISFDNQTGMWVAAVQPAFLQKQMWEMGKAWTQYVQWCLRHECLEALQSLVQWGTEVLQQQVRPLVSVSHRDAPDGSVALSCRARGFYPRPIHVAWVRDGEDTLAETDSSGILPNADGTYYMQSSLEISPQEEDRHRYACRVEHSSLPEYVLVWAPGKKGSLTPGVLAAITLAVLVLAGAIGGGVILWRRRSAGSSKHIYTPAATKNGEDSASSSSSATGIRRV